MRRISPNAFANLSQQYRADLSIHGLLTLYIPHGMLGESIVVLFKSQLRDLEAGIRGIPYGER